MSIIIYRFQRPQQKPLETSPRPYQQYHQLLHHYNHQLLHQPPFTPKKHQPVQTKPPSTYHNPTTTTRKPITDSKIHHQSWSPGEPPSRRPHAEDEGCTFESRKIEDQESGFFQSYKWWKEDYGWEEGPGCCHVRGWGTETYFYTEEEEWYLYVACHVFTRSKWKGIMKLIFKFW